MVLYIYRLYIFPHGDADGKGRCPWFDSAVCAYCVIVQFSFQETAGAGAGRPEEARARPERRAHWDHWALGAVTFNGFHNVQWQWKLFVGFAF